MWPFSKKQPTQETSAEAAAAPKEVRVEVDRIVPVGDAIVDVFEVFSRSHASQLRMFDLQRSSWLSIQQYSYSRSPVPPPPSPKPTRPEPPEWHGRVYRSCAQAFEEVGADADLIQRKALVVGDKCYLISDLCERDLQPKPKRAKGAK